MVSFATECHKSLSMKVFFVTAIAIMGLSTPGWGCTFEIGAEVCFPAKEATVTHVRNYLTKDKPMTNDVAMQQLYAFITYFGIDY